MTLGRSQLLHYQLYQLELKTTLQLLQLRENLTFELDLQDKRRLSEKP